MICKQFQDLQLSALGFGCMRLSTICGVDAKPDEAETAKLIAKAMEAGVNYYDTARAFRLSLPSVAVTPAGFSAKLGG